MGRRQIGDIVVTGSRDLMVVRYFLDGQRVDHRAPRPTVFRKHGDRWILSAHSNFGVGK